MDTLWSEIEEIMAARSALPLLKLNPGAAQKEIQSLEEHIGFVLPHELSDLLSLHNGQDSGFGLFFGLQFLSVSGIKSNWDMWRSLEGDGLNEELSESMSSQPPGCIKPLYINRGWIPFTHDGSGNHIGIDYDPDTNGTHGQIITFGRDDDVKKLKAHSFMGFMAAFAGQLRSLHWELTENGWHVFGQEHRIHYHDWKSP